MCVCYLATSSERYPLDGLVKMVRDAGISYFLLLTGSDFTYTLPNDG